MKTMKLFRLLGLISVLIFVLWGYGFAHPISSATGLLQIPSAQVLDESELSVSYNHSNRKGYASLGLGVFPGVEVGMTSQVSSNNSNIVGSLKVKLMEEDILPAISVGLMSRNSKTDYYVVGSKQLGVAGLRGHFGLGTGSYSRGFAGVSSVLNPVSVASSGNHIAIPLTTLVIEYDGAALNTGVIMRFNQHVQVRAYVSDLQSLGFGLRYTMKF